MKDGRWKVEGRRQPIHIQHSNTNSPYFPLLLSEALFLSELVMNNLEDVDVQSIVGALSAGTHGGRPHWGKINIGPATDFVAQYPHWHDFQAIRNQMDPDDVFLHDYL